MKVVYVAGKYLGNSDWETYNNIHKARVAAHRLWDEGYAVICPHANTAFFGGPNEQAKGSEWMKWITGDLEILRRCDKIYLLNNWKDSKGAGIELNEAIKSHLEVDYEL